MRVRYFTMIVCLISSGMLRAELTMGESMEVSQSFRSKVIQAVNLKNSAEMSSYFDENAILVLGNAQIIRTRTNIRAYMEAPYVEDDIKISQFVMDSLEIDQNINILDEDTFIASGTSVYEIVFTKTKQLTLPSRWLAVMHRTNSEWKIASYQTTVNVFSNPLIEKMTHIYYLVCIVAFLLGIVLTIAWKRFKKSNI